MNRWLVVLCVGALSIVACNEENENQIDGGITDAGTDGGIGTDAGTDGGIGTDAGTDGGIGTDAGTDGGTDAGTDGGPVATGEATVNGTIPGVTFTPHDAISTPDVTDTNDTIVAITDFAGACSEAQQSIVRAGAQSFAIILQNQSSGQSAPLTTGEFTVTTDVANPPEGRSALVAVVEFVCSADPNPRAVATSGTVTVDSLTNGVEGSFSVIFAGSATPVTGAFNAPTCDVSSAPSTETCQ